MKIEYESSEVQTTNKNDYITEINISKKDLISKLLNLYSMSHTQSHNPPSFLLKLQ